MRIARYLLLFLIVTGFATQAAAKSEQYAISIVSLTIKPVMPADVKAWPALPEGLLLTAEASPGLSTSPLKLVIQIKSGGALVCGNTASNGLVIGPFRSGSFTASDIQSALALCPKLSAGSYTACFRFYSEEGAALSAEWCADFRVESAESAGTTYQQPQNLLPVDNQYFVVKELEAPVVFHWSPLSPQVPGGVTYRLRIWPLTEGQTAAQGANGEPVFTRDVSDTTAVALQNVLPVPCKAPYVCRYAWSVQALDNAGKPVGDKSESSPTVLIVANYIIQVDSIRVRCTDKPGVFSFSYSLTNINAGTAKLTNLLVTSSVPAGAIITGFAPPLNTTIASGAQLTITGTISGPSSMTSICIGAEITDVANSFWKASRDTCTAVVPCKCDFCESPKTKITITPGSVVINANNTLTLTQPIVVSTSPAKNVKSVKAALIYYEYLPASEDCLPCNKLSKTYGNIDTGSLAGGLSMGAGSHGMQWSFYPYKNFSGGYNASVVITMPPGVACCAATIRWCIRYVITFDDCAICSKVVCYEKKKEGCATGTGTGTGNGGGNGNPNY